VLAHGASVDLASLGTAQVGRLLGEGSQGHVYEAVTQTGRPLALKWFKPRSATQEQHDALAQLVRLGSPDPRFLWPLSMATCEGEAGFGYVMALRDARFLAMANLMSATTPDGDPLDVPFTVVISLCRQVAECFLALHARGLCYRDINFGNVFFDPRTGDVLVCDNDNVGVDNGYARILGTPYFMAPELVRPPVGDVLPSTRTDRHSLAVLLFYALMVSHPLEGASTDRGLRDEDWLLEHFGRHPVFVFDPDDASNRPVTRHTEAYWTTYPAFLRGLFTQAFTAGLGDPTSRVVESEWVRAMVRLQDSLMPCRDCGQTNFWDEERPARPCLRCGRPLHEPLLLRVRRHRIVLSPAARLYSDHVATQAEARVPLARVRTHPQDPERWGLQNMSRESWQVTLPDQRRRRLAPGQAVDLLPGVLIRIGGVVARVTPSVGNEK
jgi:eukaryotic-like serine/threonine-protein kinase